MDAWMQIPGARVVGHRAVVRAGELGAWVACGCGFEAAVRASVNVSCCDLVQHLQAVVRAGAAVVDGDDGLAGVREPRRPLHPLGTLTAEREVS